MANENQFENYIDSLLDATTFSDSVKKDSKKVLVYLFNQGKREQRLLCATAGVKNHLKTENTLRAAILNATGENL